MCSLRFSSPGKPLDGSRIQIRKYLGCTHLCPQSTATLGLAPHHQRIQPKSWADLQLGADPQNCGQVLTQLNKIYKMENYKSIKLPPYRAQKGCLQRAILEMEELDWAWRETPMSSGTFCCLDLSGAPLLSIFKPRYILCNICDIRVFQSDSLSEIQMGF